jgi:phage gp36-like protein
VAYATSADAVTLYGEDYVLTAVDRDANGEADVSALTAALAQASGEVDSYVGRRYPTPLVSPPDIIKRLTVDIAVYQTAATFGGGLTEEKRQRYDDAIKWLTNVAKGLVVLGLPAPDASTADLPQLSTESRRFTSTTFGRLR